MAEQARERALFGGRGRPVPFTCGVTSQGGGRLWREGMTWSLYNWHKGRGPSFGGRGDQLARSVTSRRGEVAVFGERG